MAKRRADFAGSWYPADRSGCLEVIEEFKRDTRPCPNDGKKRIGGIVPHAGWLFSGRTACNVFQCINATSDPDTVVLFGGHLHPGSGCYIMVDGSWETPLGDLEVDDELASMLAREFPFELEAPGRYRQDNTIELQLPFVRHFFPKARIVPVGVPPARASLGIGEKVVELSDSLGRALVVVGSTDLTHYGPNYGFAPQGLGKQAVDWVRNEHDRRVIDRMLAMDGEGVITEGLKSQNACCPGAAATAVAAACRMGARHGVELTYAMSYDTRPDSSFVGYVGILF
ncbi:MAG: AmmeMemoRadiSam system protein B [Thermodesulfobacteriota bacterium]